MGDLDDLDTGYELKKPPLDAAVENAAKKADPKMPADVKKGILDGLKGVQQGTPGGSYEFPFLSARAAKAFADEFNTNQDPSINIHAIANGSKVVFTYPKTMKMESKNPTWDDPLENRIGQAVCDALRAYDPQIKLKTPNSLPTAPVQSATTFFADFIKQVKNEGITWKQGGDYLKVQLAFEDPKLAQAVLDKVKPLVEKEIGMRFPSELAGATLILGKDAPKVANLNFQ